MPQNTNLNVSPYFDDFDASKNYQKVLFKPATPLQARELTTLQSILQNQIEKFGQHFFKEGSMVIPGQLSYDDEYTNVQIDETHLGIPVSLYLDNLIGKTIRGETSGVTAKVERYISAIESDRDNVTLFIKYQSSSDTNFAVNTFVDGENLIAVDDIVYGASAIRAGASLATTIISNSVATGSAVKIASGVYFVRGFFITVNPQTVILDQYENSPSYRIGLLISEELAVASNSYDDLFDNAQGFSNFSAPGADRLKLTATLVKKEITDFNDENFIELMRIKEGTTQRFVEESEYALIQDEIARRIYDESGDYYVKPFSLSIKESLNNQIGNNGVYNSGQQTKQGNIPGDSRGCIIVSPGKAVVRGYDIETIDSTIIDFDKPRETAKVTNHALPFSVGRQINVRNVYGSLPVGFDTSTQVDLYSGITGVQGFTSGDKVGVARVYDLKLKNAGFANTLTQYECSLYDIQTYTTLRLSTSITLSASTFIEGTSTGSSGYVVEDVTDSDLVNLYQVSGVFKEDERISINGIVDGRIIKSVKDYGLGDIHRLVGINTAAGIGTFTADPVLSNSFSIAEPGTEFTIRAENAGISTVISSSLNFFVGIQTGDIVQYRKTGATLPTYNKVTAVNKDDNSLDLAATTSIPMISDGSLPSVEFETSDFKRVTLEILNSSNAYLYSRLKNRNIASLDLSDSQIVVRRSYTITVANNAFSSTLETDLDYSLEPFDEEDYNLTYVNDGSIEALDNQKLSVSGRTISLTNLSSNGTAILTVTFKKIKAGIKSKIFQRATSVIVNGSSLTASGIGKTTKNDGLTYTPYYGLRVQDKTISLNVPDVQEIIGIYESSDTSDPDLPRIYLENLNSSVSNFLKGERIVGETSGAVGVVATNDGINSIEIVYRNENRFSLGETITSEETNISGTINAVNIGDKNIRDNYLLDNGQRSELYDYSRIIRKADFSAPNKKIRIVFNHYAISPTDTGDFVSADSYDFDRYTSDIPSVDGMRVTDLIDLRPRVSTFNPGTATASPFEFSSRVFTVSSNSTTDVFAKDKTLNISYNYYLPRIDKLFLTKEGLFVINKGISSLSPKEPNGLDSALEIATIFLPAYVYNVKDIKFSLSTHKRYTMKDISRLESRLSNIEYYSSLSLLESDTKNLTIRDPKTGLDKFKSGFFVDNFKSYNGGDIANPQYKACVDTAKGVLRPQHYTTSLDLILGSEALVGIGTTSNPDSDVRFADDLGNEAVTRINDLVLLSYDDVEYVKNEFATRVENVNPFNTPSWVGSIELNPATDTWIETRRTERTDDIEGNFTSTMETLGVDSNTGLSPINWDVWETNWTGVTEVEGPQIAEIQTGSELVSTTVDNDWWGTTTTRTFADRSIAFQNNTFTRTTEQSRQGIQFGVSERFDTFNVGDRLVSRAVITLMRSRNIEVIARRLKPNTRVYAFFDNVDMTRFMVPKLIEVKMTSGTFEAGETVTGFVAVTGSNTSISFRLATQNHKFGPYDDAEETYTVNPYDVNSALSNDYSSTTKVLNVDTASLETQSDARFFGSIVKGMQLVGSTSGAVAEVEDIRLVSDNAGTIIASLFIPDPTIPSNPEFASGTKTLVLTTNQNNDPIRGTGESIAEGNFNSSGTLDNVENVTLRIRNATVERNIRNESRTLTETEDRLVANTITRNRLVTTRQQRRWGDPLAQTFEVQDPNGIFLTKCDLFFKTKDQGELPVTVQIRTVSLGLPTQEILPFAEVSLDPSQISVSDDASVPTTFTFPAPVFLETQNSYAIVIISNSDSYECWISRMTEEDVSTLNRPESEKIIVSQQPSLGSLFKSQNGATWDPSQLEDLKFTLYRAEFNSQQGNFKLYNPNLGVGNRQITSLRSNPIVAYSKQTLVGLAGSLNTVDTANLIPGTTVFQKNYPDFSGKLVSVVGAIGIGSELSLTNVGSGFTTNATYTNVPLKTISGRGSGAQVSLTIENNIAVAATVSAGGTAYAVGDALTVDADQTGGFGRNLVMTIPNVAGIISAFNSLIIDEIQDDIDTSGTNNEIVYINPSNGISTVTGGVVNYSESISDGLHFKVNHNNHGMYANANRVRIYGIESDVPPEKTTALYNQSATTDISVSAVGIFTSFENVGVSSDNPGYVKMNREVIKYTGVNTATSALTGITRGIDVPTDQIFSDLVISSHPVGTPVFKYEFNGVSLRRINKEHDFADTNTVKYPITIDSYHLKLDTQVSGKDRKNGAPKLFFNESKTGGTYDLNISSAGTNLLNGPKATQNIQFTSIRPNLTTLLPETTGIDARVRTVSGLSVSGDETPYNIVPFEPISLNSNNYFDTPRVICSRVNELENVSDFLGRKSFTMELNLTTTDTKVSPVVDLDRINIITTNNRINKPIEDVRTDPRVNSLYDDPHAAIYVTKVIRLDKGATSLKVYLDAFRDSSNEIIAMYRLLRADSPASQQLFEFFPGWDNLNQDGVVIDPKSNSGKPDEKILASASEADFHSYEFSTPDVPIFNGFQIKLIMTGTNQAIVPKIRDLRAIAVL
jgi:hypothetical protein